MGEPVQKTGDPEIVLGLLTSIECDSRVTQRKLASDLGIALGLANAYMRRCVRKGFVKMTQAPLNRYVYYLTPQGFAEKSRLTAEYLAAAFDFFRRARSDCAILLRQCSACGWRRVALYGASDLAEIALLSASEIGVEIVCVVDARFVGRRCAGVPVVVDLAAAYATAETNGLDGVILTDTEAPDRRYAALLAEVAARGLDASVVAVPSLLRVSRAGATGTDSL